jgi:hypothetical protein
MSSSPNPKEQKQSSSKDIGWKILHVIDALIRCISEHHVGVAGSTSYVFYSDGEPSDYWFSQCYCF